MENDNTKKLLIFNGRPDNFITWKTRFSGYLLTKNIQINQEDGTEKRRAANNVNLYRELVMHLDDSLLQAVISSGANAGIKVWAYLDEKYGKINVSQILSLWKQFIDSRVEPGETVSCYLTRSDVLIFKLESAREGISENLKIATVLKALPEEFESFNAAIQFQKIDSNELKNKLIEKSLCLPSRDLTIEENSNGVVAKIHFDKHKKNKPVYKCANCGKTNHKTESCFAPGGKLHKPKQKPSAVSGLAKSDHKLVLSSHYNCEIKLLIDSGCTDHIITDQKFLKEIDKSSPIK